jgi:hypothetical protein
VGSDTSGTLPAHSSPVTFSGSHEGSVANKQKNTKEVFSKLQEESLVSWSREEQAWFLDWIRSSSEEIHLAAELHEKILNGAKNELSGEGIVPTLRPKRVAEVLASIACSKGTDLPATVKRELQGLGIGQFQRGRPRGRRAESHYSWWVDRTQECIERSGIFVRRNELRRQYGRNWERQFKSLVRREEWPMFDLLAGSSTPRVYAIHLATRFFRRSYDHISRACGRANRTAHK